jgi:negative regulator of sigma E activity
MSEELLSALLDGECTPGEVKLLLQRLEDSPALGRRWSRMCLVRDAAENVQVRSASVDFCAGVMAAIEQDSEVPSQVAVAARTAKVIPMLLAGGRGVRARRWQPLAGLAMAASVAAVVTVGGYRWLNPPASASAVASLAQPERVNLAQAQSAQAQLAPVSYSAGGTEPVETRWSQLDADAMGQLSEYMMEHNSMRAGQGVGSALSDPRLFRAVEYRADEPH